MTGKDPLWWVKPIERLGISTMILVAVGYAAWSSGSWLATHVIEPLIQKHMQTMDVMMVTQEKQTEVQDRQTATLEKQSETLDGIHETLQDVANNQKLMNEVIERQTKSLVEGTQ